MTFPVDAVIAWVNGDDPKHIAKRAKFAPKAQVVNADAVTRFSDMGEIYLCVASILKFAPFVRRIWIVADDQAPDFLSYFAEQGICEPDRIQVVDHRDIFAGFEQVLPTFNSMAISAMLWRIPGLAEHYIYFNDDLFLTKPHRPEDFFQGGVPLVHGWRVKQRPSLITRMRRAVRAWRANTGQLQRVSVWGWQMNSARVLGNYKTYLRRAHTPSPLRVSPQRAFYTSRPDVLEQQISHRLRAASQYVSVTLAHELELRDSGALLVPPHSELGYLEPASMNNLSMAIDGIRAGEISHVCLQSLDMWKPDNVTQIRNAMLELFSSHLPKGIPVLGKTS